MWLLWLHLAGLFLFVGDWFFLLSSFLPVGIAMCRVLLYVVGDEKYT